MWVLVGNRRPGRLALLACVLAALAAPATGQAAVRRRGVARDEMAKFLTNAFNVLLYGP